MKKQIIMVISIFAVVMIAVLFVAIRKKPEMSLKMGDKVPDFTLPASSGKDFVFSKELGKKIIVLYFYPKDFTSGCTAEACTFRDEYDVFKKAGAEVIGVSSDTMESHLKFIKAEKLPFVLLSDVKGEVRKLFKVKSTIGVMPGRVTFIIDKKGIVRDVFSNQFEAKKHIENALKVINELNEK
jgi:thioredoxin-dependent peroxiredoxin